MTLKFDTSEPCAECGVSLGSHPKFPKMAVVSRADSDDHVWSAFTAPPRPLVPGGEFVVPKATPETDGSDGR